MAKQGYTRSGKSIKSVKRYYAMLNAAKKAAEKPPDDEKLSKRIAAELQIQQTANEKRGAFEDEPTVRSELPIIVMTKEPGGGPVFVPRKKGDENAAESGKSLRSNKSVRMVTDGERSCCSVI